MSTVRNYQRYELRRLESLTLQSVSHLKEGFWCNLEELHISMKVIPAQKLIGRLWWLHSSNLEMCEYFVSFIPKKLKIFIYVVDSQMYLADSVTATQRESYKVWQLECGRYAVWPLHSLAATQCGRYAVWPLHSVTTSHCVCYTV
jgi:hypothetical protein